MEPIDVLAKYLKVKPEEIQEWNDGSYTKASNDRIEYYVLDEEDYLTRLPDSWAHFEAKIGEFRIYKV